MFDEMRLLVESFGAYHALVQLDAAVNHLVPCHRVLAREGFAALEAFASIKPINTVPVVTIAGRLGLALFSVGGEAKFFRRINNCRFENHRTTSCGIGVTRKL